MANTSYDVHLYQQDPCVGTCGMSLVSDFSNPSEVFMVEGEDPLKILKTSFYPTPKYPLNSFRSQLRWKPETSSNGSTSSHFFPKFYVVLCCFTACACAWVAQQMGQSLALGKAISANEFGFGKLRVFVNVHFPQQRLAQVGRSKKVKFHRFFWRGDFSKIPRDLGL